MIEWLDSWNVWGVPLILILLWLPMTLGSALYALAWTIYDRLPSVRRKKERQLARIRQEMIEMDRLLEADNGY